MDFEALVDDDTFVLEDIRNGMYFKRFAYDGSKKTEVTPKVEDAKTFDTVSEADDYMFKHNLQHYEVDKI